MSECAMLGSVIVVFRCDASIDIGTGHVMRCLTLANALCEKGFKCKFICRELPGNLIEYIRNLGYEVLALPATDWAHQNDELSFSPIHWRWLGCTWEVDAQQSIQAIGENRPHWLVVDHYAIDKRWEDCVGSITNKILVIDDLADRAHSCDILLDQSPNRKREDYLDVVSTNAKFLIGADFALLRPEFEATRDYSLQRRRTSRLEKILISMGGVDKDDVTSKILMATSEIGQLFSTEIIVILGPHAPHLTSIKKLAIDMPIKTTVHVGTGDMAGIMAESDLALGAAGITSLERCCMGLPSIILILAENQLDNANVIRSVGAAEICDDKGALADNLRRLIVKFTDGNTLSNYSKAASKLVDGKGVSRVLAEIINA